MVPVLHRVRMVEEEHHSSPRDSLVAFGVRYAFRQTPPVRAIKYLIERANQAELNWPITYLLHEIDNPDAVEFIARQLGDLYGNGTAFTGDVGVLHPTP
jgi:hypothetical protein